MSTNILTFMMALHVKAAVFTVVVLAIIYGVRHTSSQNRYSVLKMALGVLALLPLLILTLPNYLPPFDWWGSPFTGGATASLLAGAAHGELAPLDELSFATDTLLLIGYTAVSTVLLLRVAIGFLRTRKEIRSYRRIEQAELIALANQIKRLIRAEETGTEQNVELVLDLSGASPYVWGISNQVIAVPKEFLTMTREVQRTVLTHELIHIVRRDTMICFAAKMMCCLFWINPAFWLLNARLKLEMERSCDDRAVCSGINPTDYAGHLLNVIQQFDVGRRPHSAVPMARASSIKHRIRSLLNNHRQRGIMSKSKSIGVCSALLLLGTTIGALAAKPENSTTSQAAETRTTLLRDRLEIANTATNAIKGDALIAVVKRLVPEFCDASEIRLSADAIEIDGRCATATRVSAFMRSLERAGAKPALGSVHKVDDGVDFKMRLTNLESFAPAPAP